MPIFLSPKLAHSLRNMRYWLCKSFLPVNGTYRATQGSVLRELPAGLKLVLPDEHEHVVLLGFID